MNKHFRTVIGALLTLIVCYFVYRAFSNQWAAARNHDWQLVPGWLALSAVIMLIDMALLFYLWTVLLKATSGRMLRFSAAYRISVLANLGKYIPGKVWTVAGMVYLLSDEDIPPQPALVSSALHQAFTLIPGAVFITAVLGTQVWGEASAIVVLAALTVGILALYPPMFRKLLNLGLSLFRRPPIDFDLSFTSAFLLFWAYIVAWIIYGSSFWCMTLGLGLPAGPFWPVTAAYGAAYLVGFLALFAPGGLGVREGVLAVVLTPYLPPGLSVVVAVASRLWMTIVELASLVPVLLGFGRKKPKSEEDGTPMSHE